MKLHKGSLARRVVQVGVLISAGALALAGCASSSPGADKTDAGSYFDGKTIEFVVPFGTGGGADRTARVIAPLLQKELGGGAKVVVQNIDGAGGLSGMNKVAANDNSKTFQIAMGSSSTHAAYLVGQKGVEYDLADFTALMAMPGQTILYGKPSTKLADHVDAGSKSLVYGGTAATGTDMRWLAAFELWGLDYETVFGYDGAGAAAIAFQQGEVDLANGVTSTYIANLQPLEKDGVVAPLAVSGLMEDGKLVRASQFPDTPTVAEVYKEIHGSDPSGPAWDAYLAALAGTTGLQQAIWVRSDSPKAGLEALDAAFAKIAADPDFQKKAVDLFDGEVPLVGTAAEDAAKILTEADPDGVKQLRALLTDKFGVKDLGN